MSMWLYGKSKSLWGKKKEESGCGGTCFGSDIFIFWIFFFFFFPLGSILRFPLQQTPFWPNGKGTAILQARGDGHLLQMYRKRWGGSKLAHSKKEEEIKMPCILKRWLSLCTAAAAHPRWKETRGRTRTLSKAESKPKEDFRGLYNDRGNTVGCFRRAVIRCGNCDLLKVLQLARGWDSDGPYAS